MKGWLCRKIKSFKVGEAEFEVEEHVGGEYTPIALGDWRSTLGDDFSGDVEYSIEFDCSKEVAAGAFLQDLGKVKGVSEVGLGV